LLFLLVDVLACGAAAFLVAGAFFLVSVALALGFAASFLGAAAFFVLVTAAAAGYGVLEQILLHDVEVLPSSRQAPSLVRAPSWPTSRVQKVLCTEVSEGNRRDSGNIENNG
jgi:hypothetical protein